MRSQQPELMDTETVDYPTFEACLADLAKINQHTNAYPPTLTWLQSVWPTAAHQAVTVWDIGCGGGDMLRQIVNTQLPHAELTGFDLNPWSIQAANLHTPPTMLITYQQTNVFDIPNDQCADFIICSLFTHHLTDGALIAFIEWLEAHSRRGWLINDLHRHWLPYVFIKAVVKGLQLNRLVQHDAPVSVARAFTRQDWRIALASAGLLPTDTAIQWHWPFRYTVSRLKPLATYHHA
jgi:2-polyprenyl-3-methyl-5-hydroxy-6-metoxy-1,4-benzoquinol methylase